MKCVKVLGLILVVVVLIGLVGCGAQEQTEPSVAEVSPTPSKMPSPTPEPEPDYLEWLEPYVGEWVVGELFYALALNWSDLTEEEKTEINANNPIIGMPLFLNKKELFFGGRQFEYAGSRNSLLFDKTWTPETGYIAFAFCEHSEDGAGGTVLLHIMTLTGDLEVNVDIAYDEYGGWYELTRVEPLTAEE